MRAARFGKIDALDYAGIEALNAICTNLSFAGRDVKRILVTSCGPGEGKSYLTVQIARNLAGRGRRVVVVDADLRRSALVRRYTLETDGEWRGLAHYLAGHSRLEDALYSTNLPGVSVVPAGRRVANPVMLLNAPEFARLLDDLAARFDWVLVDAPPLGAVIDAAEIAQRCDGCVLAVEYGKTRRRDLAAAVRQLRQADCPVLGCVINSVPSDRVGTGYYYGASRG